VNKVEYISMLTVLTLLASKVHYAGM